MFKFKLIANQLNYTTSNSGQSKGFKLTEKLFIHTFM